MERVLRIEWKRTPLRRIAKEVLRELGATLTTDEWSEYATQAGDITYRAIFDEVDASHFDLRLRAEGGDERALEAYVQAMETAILKGGGFVR